MGLKELLARRKFEQRVERRSRLIEKQRNTIRREPDEEIDRFIAPYLRKASKYSTRIQNTVQSRKGEGKEILKSKLMGATRTTIGFVIPQSKQKKIKVANPVIKRRKK